MPYTREVTVEQSNDLEYGVEGVGLDVAWFSDYETVKRPAVVSIHGGLFILGDKSSFDKGSNPWEYDKAKYFTDLGYVYVSVNYRLAENANLLSWLQGSAELDFTSTDWTERLGVDDQATDVATALKWVIDNAENWGIDASNIAMFGHSAGCHLIAQLGSRSFLGDRFAEIRPSIKGVVLTDSENYDIRTALKAVDPSTTDNNDWGYMNVYGVNPSINTVDFEDEATAELTWAAKSVYETIANSEIPKENYFSNWYVVTRGTEERIANNQALATAIEEKGLTATLLTYPGLIYDHEGIHKVLGSENDYVDDASELTELNIKSFSTELSGWLTAAFAAEPEPTPEPTPEPEVDSNAIGRVVIARGIVAWDVNPPAWDNLVPPCCEEEKEEEG